MPSTYNIPTPPRLRGEWPTYEVAYATAAQTFRVGDLLIFDAAGTLSIAAAADTNVGNVLIVGVSCDDAEKCLALNTKVRVATPNPSDEMLFQLYHGTPASGVLAVGDLDAPTSLPIRNNGGHQWVLDVSADGTNDRAVVTDFDPAYPPSTALGWVWARLLLAKQIWQSAT